MQSPNFKTSPPQDAIAPEFYGIKGTTYPEDSRMLRVIEWFKRLEGFRYADIENINL